MSNERLAVAYTAATAAFLLVLLSLHVPWTSAEGNSSRLMWDRQEGPSIDGNRETIYYFDADANFYPPDLALFRTAAALTASATFLLALLGPVAILPWAVTGKISRLGPWTAGAAGLLLVAAAPTWFSAEDNNGFGPGAWLCILAGVLALVAAAKLAQIPLESTSPG